MAQAVASVSRLRFPLVRSANRLPGITFLFESTFMAPLFGFFGTHPWELLLIGAVVLLLFGNRLPALMRSVGRSVVEFKRGVNETDEDDGAKAVIDDHAKAPTGKS